MRRRCRSDSLLHVVETRRRRVKRPKGVAFNGRASCRRVFSLRRYTRDPFYCQHITITIYFLMKRWKFSFRYYYYRKSIKPMIESIRIITECSDWCSVRTWIDSELSNFEVFYLVENVQQSITHLFVSFSWFGEFHWLLIKKIFTEIGNYHHHHHYLSLLWFQLMSNYFFTEHNFTVTNTSWNSVKNFHS